MEIDRVQDMKLLYFLMVIIVTKFIIYKLVANERDDKWFLKFPSKMIECGRVVIVNMYEA